MKADLKILLCINNVFVNNYNFPYETSITGVLTINELPIALNNKTIIINSDMIIHIIIQFVIKH